MELTAFQNEKAATAKRVEKLMRRLADKMPAREWSAKDRCHTEDNGFAKRKLFELVEQLSARLNELENEVAKGCEVVVNLIVVAGYRETGK